MRNEYVSESNCKKMIYKIYYADVYHTWIFKKKIVLVIALDGLNCSRSWSSNLKVKSYLYKRHFLKGTLQATFTSNSCIENI